MPVSGESPRSANTALKTARLPIRPWITGERNAYTGTSRRVVHDRDGRLSQVVDFSSETANPTKVVESLILRRRLRSVGAPPAEIHSRTESAALAGKDRHLDFSRMRPHAEWVSRLSVGPIRSTASCVPGLMARPLHVTVKHQGVSWKPPDASAPHFAGLVRNRWHASQVPRGWNRAERGCRCC